MKNPNGSALLDSFGPARPDENSAPTADPYRYLCAAVIAQAWLDLRDPAGPHFRSALDFLSSPDYKILALALGVPPDLLFAPLGRLNIKARTGI